jgi:protein involved in sex pheromone biosynthesis
MIRVFIVALASVFILNSCEKSSKEIEGEVREMWLQNLKKEQVTGVSVLEVSLIQKSDSLYTGVLKTKEPEGTFIYNLEVSVAGDKLSYEVIGDGIPTDGRNTHEPDDQPAELDSLHQ